MGGGRIDRGLARARRSTKLAPIATSGTGEEEDAMQVKDGMTPTVLTIGPSHTLREAARQMARRKVGAAIVLDPEQPGPGIITERDLLDSIGAGQDPDSERVCDHLSPEITFAAPDWSLERAAEAMVKGSFRHLVVVEDGEIAGVLSMRDIVRCWTNEGATCDVSG
jgi:CBS domain-containing protein